MAEILLHAEHGSRLARGWLAAQAAAENDAERPALHRTTLIDVFEHGVRFSATDSYWSATAWVGDPEDDSDGAPSMPAPEWDEVPVRSVAVCDHEYRIRDLLSYVVRRTVKVDPEHPDIALTVTVRTERSDEVPTLDPLFDRDRVDVLIPGVEQVAGYVNEVEYPNVARIHWQYDAASATALDAVQLNPDLLRKLAKSCSAVGSVGLRFTFHGDPAKPLSWEVVQPAAAELSGLVMPQRPAESRPLTPPPSSPTDDAVKSFVDSIAESGIDSVTISSNVSDQVVTIQGRKPKATKPKGGK